MQPEQIHITQLRKSLLRNWDLAESSGEAYAHLRESLTEAIATMLNYHPERLTQIMYRLDVNEMAFRAALTKPDAPSHIADLVLERETQRIRFRQQFQSRNSSDSAPHG